MFLSGNKNDRFRNTLSGILPVGQKNSGGVVRRSDVLLD
jgi:hypothetical protein